MVQEDRKMERPSVQELDNVLGRRWKVLDDGFVRVVDYLGCDQAIVQAARVSYGAGTKAVHEDKSLIRYLIRNGHTTPFEMCELKLHVRVPMDIWRQWIRHRTANVNEYSTRYSIAIASTATTSPDCWRIQSRKVRQGSEGFLSSDIGIELTRREYELQQLARNVYEERVTRGVAREQARKDLPLSTYTEAYWKIDLHNLLHFLSLRMSIHAQKEIRAYATVIGEELVSRWCPITWQAFKDYRINSVTLSALELDIVRCLAAGDSGRALQIASEHGWLARRGSQLRFNSERQEAEQKLLAIGYTPPWT